MLRQACYLMLFAGCFVLGARAAEALPFTQTEVENTVIPDGNVGGVTFSMDVGTAGTIIGPVTIDLNIEHTFVGDLTIQLSSPGGAVTITLLDSPQSLPVLLFGDDDNFISTNTYSFDDTAGANAETIGNGDYISDLDVPSGSWVPNEGGGADLLANFNSLSLAGTWTLFISDNSFGEVGQLISWTLNAEFIPAPEPSQFSLLALGAGLLVWRRRHVRSHGTVAAAS